MHPGETFFIPARLSSPRRDLLYPDETSCRSRRDFLYSGKTSCRSQRDFLPTPTGAGRSSAILASLAIFATLVIPVIRSFECHFLNGKKIHADRRQGDRREDFERTSDRGPREFSRSSEEPCAVDAWRRGLIASPHDGKTRKRAPRTAAIMDCAADPRPFHSGRLHTCRRSDIRRSRHFHVAVQRPLPRGRRVQNSCVAPGPSVPGNLRPRVRRDHPRSAPASNCPRPPRSHFLPDSGRLVHVAHRQFFVQTA